MGDLTAENDPAEFIFRNTGHVQILQQLQTDSQGHVWLNE